MIFYYSSLNNLIKNKQCCKLYAYLCKGYLIKNISNFNNFIFLRIQKLHKNKYHGLINYEIFNNTIIIHNLSVENKYQKKGLGMNLLKRVETYAISKNIHQIILYMHQNMRNLDFYKKRGYDINYINNNYVKWTENKNYIQMIKYLNYPD